MLIPESFCMALTAFRFCEGLSTFGPGPSSMPGCPVLVLRSVVLNGGFRLPWPSGVNL